MALLLQDERVDPTVRDNQAIRYAALDGHTGVVALLLPRVDPTAEDNYAIQNAAKKAGTPQSSS